MWRRILALTSALSRAALVSVLVAIVLVPQTSLAAPADAERSAARHFADGQKAFTAGDYAHAADEFEAAYRDKPHHAPLWNAARSWQRAGEDVRAANLYARYLREAPPDAPDRDQATTALRGLTGRMGRIEPHASGVDKLRLDGKPVDAPVVYVAPGEHVAEADDHGKAVRKVVTVRAGEQTSVTLAPAQETSASTEPLVGPPRDARERRDQLGKDDAAIASRRPLSPVVVVLGAALTAVAGGFTVASGLDTISKRNAFPAEPTQSRLDAAFASQTRTNVLIGTTVGLGVVTAVLAGFFTDWSGGAAPREVGTAR
jgi:hypothetical protein